MLRAELGRADGGAAGADDARGAGVVGRLPLVPDQERALEQVVRERGGDPGRDGMLGKERARAVGGAVGRVGRGVPGLDGAVPLVRALGRGAGQVLRAQHLAAARQRLAAAHRARAQRGRRLAEHLHRAHAGLARVPRQELARRQQRAAALGLQGLLARRGRPHRPRRRRQRTRLRQEAAGQD